MPSKHIQILSMDFWLPWKQNRICALSQFISDQPQLPNRTLLISTSWHVCQLGPALAPTFPLEVSVLPWTAGRGATAASAWLPAAQTAPCWSMLSVPFPRCGWGWTLGAAWHLLGCSLEQRLSLPGPSPHTARAQCVSHQPCLLPPACSRPHGRNAQDSPTLGCHWVFMCLQFFSLCNSFKNLSAMDIDFTD